MKEEAPPGDGYHLFNGVGTDSTKQAAFGPVRVYSRNHLLYHRYMNQNTSVPSKR